MTERKLPIINVIHEDEFCVVINKPAGLAVQGGTGVKVSVDALLSAMYPEKPLLVHRLDKETSGALLLAKTKRVAAYFSSLIAAGEIIKRYIAVCAIPPELPAPPSRGVIELPLQYRDGEKAARTKWKIKKRAAGWTVLELELDTGRTHQIRRHLAALGWHLLGDERYGNFKLNKRLRKELQLKNMLLHAASLCAPLPDGSILNALARPPAYFDSFL
ncbi:MAG: RNA pseudouridine synthase [Spirochaetaceae bacterium]|nr:RNA pseudouridine synthase [Spirochaetaceae bacterium]